MCGTRVRCSTQCLEHLDNYSMMCMPCYSTSMHVRRKAQVCFAGFACHVYRYACHLSLHATGCMHACIGLPTTLRAPAAANPPKGPSRSATPKRRHDPAQPLGEAGPQAQEIEPLALFQPWRRLGGPPRPRPPPAPLYRRRPM